ncbi:23S rRNA (adenine(2030)-N(6))-methyltransferase RlmJ [Aestuariivirga sp.]|jgi:23S rRNA (adenine2030-N6)-methyltransferase|uniref:23S rRNA (adenine(2030)-N(6))-methyltransferase RlmJ n=1 Tax=Aestuariivirga sp. TaxID=2650926 RepID=UPI0037844557
MNYRHAYHAGNHADVLKHAVLARVITHMMKKDKPFRVIDAHAGTGVYDLGGIEAGKTGEWEGGIGRLAEPFAAEVEALLAPYRQVIAALNPQGGVRIYPGSPELALRLMRDSDRMIANELHPQDAVTLERHFIRDARVEVTSMDAETCLKSRLPPPERRGVILIDPPYEVKDEAERTLRMLAHGLRRFALGVFVVWYPLKADRTAETVLEGIAELKIPGTLKVELRVREAFSGGGLAGSGLAIVNAPWRLDEELSVLVPQLAARLGLGSWGKAAVEWINAPT